MRKWFTISAILSLPLWGHCQWSLCDNADVEGNPPLVLEIIDDTLFVGGWFLNINNVAFNGIGKWDGQQWSDFPSTDGIDDIKVFGDSIVVSGGFNDQGGVDGCNGIAAFHNGEWLSMGGGLSSPAAFVRAFEVRENQIMAVGSFSEIGGLEPVQRVAVWDGNNWLDVGGVSGFVGEPFSSTLFMDDVYVGGNFALADGNVSSPNLAHWNGAEWIEVLSGTSGTIREIYPAEEHGFMYVGGLFSFAGDEPSPGIAKFDGINTTPISNIGFNNEARAICVYREQIYAAGAFDQLSDGSPMNGISRFDGVNWQPVQGGVGGSVFDLEVYQDELYAAGAITWVGEDQMSAEGLVRWYLHPDSVTWGVPDTVPSVNETFLLEHVYKIFPNPSGGQFTLEFAHGSEMAVLVTDMQGRQVFFDDTGWRKNVLIDLTNEPSGQYLVSLVELGRLFGTQRLFKE